MSFRLHMKALADLLVPRRCIVCGRKLHVREEHLCLYCHADMPRTYFQKLRRNPMSDRFNMVIQKGLDAVLEEGEAAPDGLSVPYEHYVHASALFFFRNGSDYRQIPYMIKYHGDVRAGRYFGRMLGQSLSESRWMADVDMVIPVPLHWRRRWSRGYNQAEVIASEVARTLGVPMRTDILRRTKYTETQTKLTIAEKARNVQGAFRAEKAPDDGTSHILLIDDVFTTGATLYSCYLALKEVLPPSVRISIATLGFVGE